MSVTKIEHRVVHRMLIDLNFFIIIDFIIVYRNEVAFKKTAFRKILLFEYAPFKHSSITWHLSVYMSTLPRADEFQFLTVPQMAEQAIIFERNLTLWKTNSWKQQLILHSE